MSDEQSHSGGEIAGDAAHDRRAFLKKLAVGAAYTAPVVASFGRPERLLGQSEASTKGGGADMDKSTMGGGKGMTGMLVAPWEASPPGGG